jgi:flagellar biosynthesis protein
MNHDPSDPLISKNRAKSQQTIAAAIQNDPTNSDLPKIIAAGRGKWAEQILDLAFANGLKVRQDPALANILASIELDSPIPTEAIMAVAEILAYVYQVDGKTVPLSEDPFRLGDND